MDEATATLDRLMTTQEIAAHYRVTEQTIKNWRSAGKVPFIRINARCYRYELEKVKAALEAKATAV